MITRSIARPVARGVCRPTFNRASDDGIIRLTEAEWEALTEYDWAQPYIVEGVGEYLGPTLVEPVAWEYGVNDLHVTKSGNDGNAGTFASPKLTIWSAFNSISLANGTPITIWVDAGTYTENASGGYFLFTKAFTNFVTVRGRPGTRPILTSASGSYVIRPNGTCANIRFRNLEIQTIAATVTPIFYNGSNLTNFEIVECLVSDANSKATAINFSGTAGQTGIAVKRCVMTSASTFNLSSSFGSGSKFIGNTMTGTALGNITANVGTYNVNSNIIPGSITTAGHATTPTTISILGNTCRNIVYTGGATGNRSLLNIDRNTVDAGVGIRGIAVSGYTQGGTCNANHVTSLGDTGLGWPMDGGTSVCDGHTINENTVINHGTTGHGILVSVGGTNVIIMGNNTDQSDGGSYGMVLKGTNNTATYNTLRGGTLTGILLKDCSGITFSHNTVYSDGASAVALRFDESDTASVTNNTFIVTNGTLYTLTLANDGSVGDNVVDLNSYSVSGAGAWGTMFGNTVASLANVQAQWAANYPASPTNDSNSVSV